MSSNKLNANRAVSLRSGTPRANKMSLLRLSTLVPLQPPPVHQSSPPPLLPSPSPFPSPPFLPAFEFPLPTGSPPLTAAAEGQSPCVHRGYSQALLTRSAARSQHTGASEASPRLPPTRKPGMAHVTEMPLHWSQPSKQGKKSKTPHSR